MILDFHSHIYPPYIIENKTKLFTEDGTLKDLFSGKNSLMASSEMLISSMDKNNVDVSVVLGIGWNNERLCQISNNYIIDSVKRHPHRLKGFFSVNPLWGQRALEEIDRCSREGLMGIGELHPYSQGYDLADKKLMKPLMDKCSELNLPVLVHASEPLGHDYPGKGNTTPDVLYRFISNFPDSVIILAHFGGGLPFYNFMPEVSKAMKNVFFDTAALPFIYESGLFDVIDKIIGHDKVIFGTDFPLMEQSRMYDEIVNSNLSDTAKADILYNNGFKLLHGDRSL